MISRVTTAVIAGTTVRVLSTPDLLVHVCAHVAAGHAPDSTGWVADLATLARHGMFSQSDWDRIVDVASRGGLALPLFTMLRYIDHEIGVSVPPRALSELAECGSHASATARDAALDTACRGNHLKARAIFRRSGWRSRLQIVRFLVVPSKSYLRSWCAERGLAWSPRWYVTRPLRHIALRMLRYRPTKLTASWRGDCRAE